MKRLIALILVLSLALSFSACGNNNKTEKPNEDLNVKNEQVLEDEKTVESIIEGDENQTEDEKDKEDTKDVASTVKDSSNKNTAVDSNKNTSSNTSAASKPSTKPSTSTSTTAKPSTKPSSGSSSSASKPSTNTGSSSNTSSSSSGSGSSSSEVSKPSTGITNEKPKERTVTVTVPVYGEMYRVYWIMDENKNVIFESKSPTEWESKLDELALDPNAPLVTYGSEGKNDIVGYKSYTITESEYKESWWYNDPDVPVKYN